MTIGSTMPIVTTIDAGAIIAAAVHPGSPVRAGAAAAAVIRGLPRFEDSALEALVPPLLQRGIVLREVAVIEIDQALALVGAEADALFRLGRDLRVVDAAVVAHVLGERLLRRRREHLVQPDVRAVLVRRVLRDHEPGDVEWNSFLRR